MLTSPWLHDPLLTSPLLSPSRRFQNPSPYLTPKPSRLTPKVTSGDSNQNPSPNPLKLVLDIPRTIWKRTLQPLSDFGFGRRSIWEGGVGLFVTSGAVLFALTIVWLKGYRFRSQFRKYQAVFEFSQACGICVGTPVRIRGVTVGSVVGVNSSLKSIDAVVEVEDDKIIIPRNSLVEVNQSGLLMETMIDITPKDPLPTPFTSPLDPDCVEEGLIVCNRQRMKGEQGVSLDELVGIFTRIGREMDKIGVAKSFELAEKVASVVQEAQPLIAKIAGHEDLPWAGWIIGCTVDSLPTRYLGLPLGAKHRRKEIWKNVLERIQQTLGSWKNKTLSKAGRLTMIKSVLTNLPIYYMPLFKMPKGVAQSVDKLSRDILWNKQNGEDGTSWSPVGKVCFPKKWDGLGVRKPRK